MRFQKRRISLWAVLVAVIIAMSILALLIQQSGSGQDVYVGTSATTPSTTSRKLTELVMHTAERTGLHYGVPEDWTAVIMGGHPTYVHQPSGTSLQVIEEDYSPLLLQMNESLAAEYASNKGGELTSFYWLDANSFTVIYRKNASQQEKSTAFLDVIQFDRASAVTISISATAQYSSAMSDVIDDIMASVYWERQNPWPDNTFVVYSDYGAFEFAYPGTWNIGVAESAYIAQDPETGAAMSVAVAENQTNYEGITQITYSEYASQSRSEFALQTFASDKSIIYALGSYVNNGQDMVMVQYFLAGDRFEYVLTFETPYSAYQQQAALFDGIIKTFRYYPTETPESDIPESEEQTEPNEAIPNDTQTPDLQVETEAPLPSSTEEYVIPAEVLPEEIITTTTTATIKEG